MQNNIDYREIVQTVTANVIKDIKSMQPGIVDDIVKRALSSLQTSLDSINRQLEDIQKRLTKLEQKKGEALSAKPKSTQASSPSGTTNTSSEPPQIDTQTRIMLLKILDSYVKTSWNGWFIYREKKDVFMIRKNGTDKKDITKYFQHTPSEFNQIIENGSDLIVKYKYFIGMDHNNFAMHQTEYAVIPKP